MTVKAIIETLCADTRNQAYTARGIAPIFQIHENAKILLIGQAPGRKVEESGIPFHDKSGETLMQWLGIAKETFYGPLVSILPMDFYYPGKGKTGDLPPRPFIAKEYHHQLLEAMPQVELTVLIGKYAIDYYLKGQTEKNLTETVRHYEQYLPSYFPIVHPSPLNFRWQTKNPWFLDEIVPVLRQKVHALISV